jgi:hypothetical protein
LIINYSEVWNADVYNYINGGNVDMNRLKKSALIILRSGIISPAASEIILSYNNKG